MSKPSPRRHSGPPPGYLTRQGVAAALDVSSARLGKAGVLELLDSWQFANGQRPHPLKITPVLGTPAGAGWRQTTRADGIVTMFVMR